MGRWGRVTPSRPNASDPRATDEVQPFELDEDFDYDNVELSQRKQTANGWEESSSGLTFQDFIHAAGGEAAFEQQLREGIAKASAWTGTRSSGAQFMVFFPVFQTECTVSERSHTFIITYRIIYRMF